MRIVNVSIVVGPLLLIGALPATGQATVAPGAGVSVPVPSAAGGDSTAERTTYAQKARDDMLEWQRKLRHFGAKMAAEGNEAGSRAEKDLQKTWTKAEAAARGLQTASAEGWDSAKTSFEEASRELAEAWHKIRPQDK